MPEETVTDLKLKNQEDKFQLMFEANTKEHLAINERLETLVQRMETVIEKMDKKYAPMLAWKVMTWGGGIIGGFLLLYALNRLFIK